MSLLAGIGYFFLGSCIGHGLPRFPFLLMSRTNGFNTNFPRHPEAIPLSPHLTQRVLHMRMFYWMGMAAVFLPLSLGLVSVRWGNAAFGFGLWIAGGWYLLNRLQSLIGGQTPPWTKQMALELQILSNLAEQPGGCCNWTSPYWQVTGIVCVNCNSKLSNMPRPDLGRKRSERKPLGFLRLIISDGYPMLSVPDEEE
ncbi:MAG: hypothetical protein HOB47_01540 [Euryarchaeota archaeon]|nr:hypothetical protein [Euryarchaeota archaeon]MBT6640254.1 hypothetical protein [Euryarchaeota archaeon]MBT6844578.1 hypothetical protein [Euryarchaeota archaeon]